MNCDKITYYIEKGYLTDLKISEKIQVRLHKMICDCCKNYEPDSEFVNLVLNMIKEEDNSSNLSDQEKDDLKQALENLE